MEYRDILSAKLQERRRVNPRYSLRAFAKDLKISPSRLSDVLAGKGELSVVKARYIAKQIQLSPLATVDFIDMVEAKGRSASSIRNAATKRVQTRKTIDDVKLLSQEDLATAYDCRSLAVWSFMTLPAFDGCIQTIARHLKMNRIEVEDILRRLERLNMVSVNGKTCIVGSRLMYAGWDVPQKTLRLLHHEMSTLGRNSIEGQEFSERHLESAILTIDRSRIGEIKQHIANFSRFLLKEYADLPTNDAVYGLSLQLFKMAEPLSLPKMSQ